MVPIRNVKWSCQDSVKGLISSKKWWDEMKNNNERYWDVFRNKSMHTSTNYFLFSLAIADLTILFMGRRYFCSFLYVVLILILSLCWFPTIELYHGLFFFLDALTSLGSMLETQRLIHVFEHLSNLGHIIRLSSDYHQAIFRLSLGYHQAISRHIY